VTQIRLLGRHELPPRRMRAMPSDRRNASHGITFLAFRKVIAIYARQMDSLVVGYADSMVDHKARQARAVNQDNAT
jgi:hypothetical protein